MSNYTMAAWDLAVELYEASNRTCIPLHRRDVSVRAAWLKAAQTNLAQLGDVLPALVLGDVVDAADAVH